MYTKLRNEGCGNLKTIQHVDDLLNFPGKFKHLRNIIVPTHQLTIRGQEYTQYYYYYYCCVFCSLAATDVDIARYRLEAKNTHREGCSLMLIS